MSTIEGTQTQPNLDRDGKSRTRIQRAVQAGGFALMVVAAYVSVAAFLLWPVLDAAARAYA